MKHNLVYFSVSKLKLIIYFIGKNNNFNFFLRCYLLQTNLCKMLKQNVYSM